MFLRGARAATKANWRAGRSSSCFPYPVTANILLPVQRQYNSNAKYEQFKFFNKTKLGNNGIYIQM
jgi:hypothetical protein